MSDARFISLEEIKEENTTHETELMINEVYPHYFQAFSTKDIEQLKKKYKKSLSELALLIQQHKKYYRLDYGLNIGSLISNLLFCGFLIRIGKDGIKGLAQIINPTINISNEIAYGINTPLAVTDSTAYSLTFSPRNKAIENVLLYAHTESWKDWLEKKFYEFYYHPRATLKRCVQYHFHQTVLLITNATSSMTLVLEMLNALESVSPILKWTVVLLVAYFGIRFLVNFTNNDYHRAIQSFWKNEQKDPWLIHEFFHGDVARALQAAFQGVFCASIFNAVVFYLYVADDAQKKLGFWIKPEVAAAISVWHGLCVRHSKTYEYYYRDEINLRKYLRSQINVVQIDAMIVNYLHQLNINDLPADELKQLQTMFITEQLLLQKKILQQAILKDYGFLFLFKKEKIMLFPILVRILIGAGIGYTFLAPLLQKYLINEPISTALLGMLVCGLSLGSFLYRAEQSRVMSKLMYEKVSEQKETIVQSETVKHQCFSWLLSLFNAWLVFGNNAASMMADIGGGVRVFKNVFHSESYAATFGIVMIAIEKTVNNYFLMRDKINNVLQGFCKPSRTAGTMFYKRQTESTAQSELELKMVPN